MNNPPGRQWTHGSDVFKDEFEQVFVDLHSPSKHLLVQSNNENTKSGCEICLNLTIKTPEWRYC